ncbi:MAG: hypothetical protein NT067_04065 [Candidatus Diapherotrites archaeon]|nr:hypothetical protein [Candidatus Diapherotrites archaeon]
MAFLRRRAVPSGNGNSTRAGSREGRAVRKLARRVNLYMGDSVKGFDSEVFARHGFKTRVEKEIETVDGKQVWSGRLKLTFTPMQKE